VRSAEYRRGDLVRVTHLVGGVDVRQIFRITQVNRSPAFGEHAEMITYDCEAVASGKDVKSIRTTGTWHASELSPAAVAS
jgi:hypothetical protein